jgi:hypothetical protein
MCSHVSLVIAFIGMQGAVMAGDTREIITIGDDISTEILEHELYSGQLITDEDVKKRAVDLGINLTINDDKRKVTQRNGILIGEVSETRCGVTRKRRLYATAGEYILTEVTGSTVKVTGKGTASNFVVLGNEITQRIAHACIREQWNKGGMQDAIRIIMLAMKRASDATASVSGLYNLINTAMKISLSEVIDRDNCL